MSQTVLVIDDSPDVHRLLEVRLRPEGLILHCALSAEEGLAKARDAKPDLILLDVDLPLMTGFEVCQKLKEDSTLAQVPVIFLTGASEVHTKVQGFDLGAVDYVTKPFEPAELRARVRAALRTKRYHDLLSARSHVDGLTGVWNRSYFNQRFGEEVDGNRPGKDVLTRTFGAGSVAGGSALGVYAALSASDGSGRSGRRRRMAREKGPATTSGRISAVIAVGNPSGVRVASIAVKACSQ